MRSFASSLVLFFVLHSTAFAQQNSISSQVVSDDDRLPGNSYYMINENGFRGENFMNPYQLMQIQLKNASEVNLLSWIHFRTPPPAPNERYNRPTQFGYWIDFPNDRTCLTTRGLVLARDSRSPLSYIPNDPCYVASGKWWDPYTNQVFTDAKKVQIDHMVPVKNAYLSGAYKWSWKARCSYLNFVGNNYHLLPVEGSTNSRKSDSSPDRWMPPNKQFHCQYIANWLNVKSVWQLVMTESETRAILQIIRQNNCNPSAFALPRQEIQRLRALASQQAEICLVAEQDHPGRHRNFQSQ